jgi:hypothetical protein
MNKEERKEKARLHKDLVTLLVATPNGTAYYTRLMWANQIIANILANFEEAVQTNEKT